MRVSQVWKSTVRWLPGAAVGLGLLTMSLAPAQAAIYRWVGPDGVTSPSTSIRDRTSSTGFRS